MSKDQNKNLSIYKPRPTTLKGVPFAWQDKRVTKMIRDNFSRRKKSIAIALYQALTELASNAGGKQGRAVSSFSAYQEGLAERIGKSVSTVKRYLEDFERLEIISCQNRKWGYKNLANLFTLNDYSGHNIEPTSPQNTDLSTVAHNIELPSKERRKDYIIINKDVDKSENNRGFQPINKILDKRKI